MKRRNNGAVPSEGADPSVQKTAGKGKGWSVGYLIVAFIAALMLWFYVADYDTIVEHTFTNIPVELIYPTKGDIVVESGEGKLINVTVRGKKADINAIRTEDIRAYVDLSRASADGEINAEIEVELPNDVTLVENNALSVTHLVVTLATPTSKQLDLEVNIVSGNWEDIYTLIPECEPSTVEVIGSSSIVDRVKSARVNIDVGDLERPKQVRGKIELIDGNGETVPQTYLKITEPNGAEISNSVVEVYVRMEMEKELSVLVEFTGGVFSPSDARISCNPGTVTVRGGVEKLRKLESVSIPVDETTIGNSFKGKLPLPELDGSIVYVDDVSEVDVSIEFRDVQTMTLTLSTEDLLAVGLPEGLEARFQFLAGDDGLIPETVEITVRGYRESIIDLRREQLDLLDLTVDFTEFADSETGVQAGQKYASLDVEIGFRGLQGVFTTDKVRVSAEIAESDTSGRS